MESLRKQTEICNDLGKIEALSEVLGDLENVLEKLEDKKMFADILAGCLGFGSLISTLGLGSYILASLVVTVGSTFYLPLIAGVVGVAVATDKLTAHKRLRQNQVRVYAKN